MATAGYALKDSATGAVPIEQGGTATTSLPTGFLIGAGTGAITALTNVPWANYTATLTLVGGAGNTVPVYASTVSRYSQVDKRVLVHCRFNGDGGDEGAGTGKLTMALPVNAGANWKGGALLIGTFINGSSSTVTPIWGSISANGSTISFNKFTAYNTIADMTGADQNNTTRTIDVAFWYEST